MKYLLLISVVILSGCGPANLLKRSQELERRAIAKGAIVTHKTDTIFQEVQIQVPVIKMDTVVKLTTDTIRVKQNGIDTKIVIRDKKVYIKQVVHPPPITVRRTIYVNNTKTIKTGKTGFEYWSAAIGMLIFGFVLGFILSKLLWR